MQINVIEDPRLIRGNDLPVHFILSNVTTSFIAFGIDWFTKANYDHCMQQISVGQFVTQDFWGYRQAAIDGYLKKGGILKFVRINNVSDEFNTAFTMTIANRLTQPWYKKIYDFGNIIGRMVGLPWVHLPGTFDCSEVSLWVVRKNSMYLPKNVFDVIMALPETASPDDIDQCIKSNPDKFTIYGIWSSDQGVIV